MSLDSIVHVDVLTLPRRILVYNSNKSKLDNVDFSLFDAIGRLTRQKVCLFKLGPSVIFCAGIEKEVADDLSRLRTTGVDTGPIEDDPPVFPIDTAIRYLAMVRLYSDYQTSVKIFEHINNLKKGVTSTLHKFLTYYAKEPFRTYVALSTQTAHNKYKTRKKELIVRAKPINNTV